MRACMVLCLPVCRKLSAGFTNFVEARISCATNARFDLFFSFPAEGNTKSPTFLHFLLHKVTRANLVFDILMASLLIVLLSYLFPPSPFL